jgi:FtsP/CotA-like multicopper oxidase with cupredoxin domain
MGGVFMAFVTGSARRRQAESVGVDWRGLAAATRQYTVAQQSAILQPLQRQSGGKMGTPLAKNALSRRRFLTTGAGVGTAPLATIRDEEITGRRRLTFSSKAPEAADSEHWQEYKFQIDGRNFDMNRVDQRVRLGAVEEWTIINLHIHDHIFHIHTNPFQLTKVNGEALAEPVWGDTVVLPRNGSLTFRSRFLDFTGRFMLHCHMMNHEELGMMQVVEVYKP